MREALKLAVSRAILDSEILPFHIPKVAQSFSKRFEISCVEFGGNCFQHADAMHALRPLRNRGKRPHGRRAAKQRDEVAPFHSITSSAMARSEGGTVRPSIRAVPVLMTNSNLLDCTIGRSAGFAPLRMRPV